MMMVVVFVVAQQLAFTKSVPLKIVNRNITPFHSLLLFYPINLLG